MGAPGLVALLLLGATAVPLLALLPAAIAPPPADLLPAAWNSLRAAALAALLAVPPGFAWALARGRGAAAGGALLVLALAPSVLPALVLRQGLGVEGVWGVALAQALTATPLVALLLGAARGDRQLEEAALALGAGWARRFRTITLPGAAPSLLGAAGLVFALALADFGAPAVLGGEAPFLATGVVRHLAQGEAGAAALLALALLVPAWLVAGAWWRAGAAMEGPAPRLSAGGGVLLLGVAGLLACLALAPLPGLGTSMGLALQVGLLGTPLALALAWALARGPAAATLRLGWGFALFVPGLALGLGGWLLLPEASGALLLPVLVMQGLALSWPLAAAALRRLDPDLAAAGAGLRAPAWEVALRILLPPCLPALPALFAALFVGAMGAVSAVALLHAPGAAPATLAVVQRAAAEEALVLAFSILAVNLAAVGLLGLMQGALERRAAEWRRD